MNITDKNGVHRVKDDKGRFARSPSDYKIKYGANNKATILDPENKPVANVYSYDREDIKAEINEDIERWEKEQAEKEEQIKAHAEEAKKAKAAEYVEDDIFTAKRPLSKRSEEEVKEDLLEAQQYAEQYIDAYKEGIIDENPYAVDGSLNYWENKVRQYKQELGEVRKRKGWEKRQSWK